ncbi:hypothetical protein LTR70_007783 [Exophiala xenobiotica]|nr:hypothetical protein LTR70_007783 [Exophiala xenobiotica]
MTARDRTANVPPDVGDRVLPNSPFFGRLVRFAHEDPLPLAIRDLNLNVEKTYLQLLTDVLAVRNRLRRGLTSETIEDISRGVDTFIGVFAAGGYEYTVAMLAVLALGAAVVPMSTASSVEEVIYFVEKSRQVAILCATSSEPAACSVASRISANRNAELPCITIGSLFQSAPLLPHEITISSDRYLDDNSAGLVIFTSGTTGKPKGAVMRRGYIHDAALAVADSYRINSQDVLLHVLPVHHALGIGLMFFAFLYAGALIEFRSGSFDPEWMWERWRRGGLTFFAGVSTIYMRMKRYFEQKLAKLAPEAKYDYLQGVRNFKVLFCGAGALPHPIAAFWTDMRGGKRVLQRYGATEFGAVITIRLNDENTPDGSVGQVTPGVELKLSGGGDEGEILIKSSQMFSRYLDDQVATTNVHDENGFFKTGDIARREGKYYFILGRASLDIIKSGGYKISALEIEREVLALPYIEEVMVVAVEDEEYGQRVAALVSLRQDQGLQELKISRLRADLMERMAGYKMPTLLRVVEGELPKGSTGKVLKKTLGPLFFPTDWEQHCPPEGEKRGWIQAWYSQAKPKL